MIMIDQLLSINMMMTAFVNQLLTMGLPVIDGGFNVQMHYAAKL